MNIKIFILLMVFLATFTQKTLAFEAKETQKYFNGPTISNVSKNSATISLSKSVIAGLTEEEKSRIYFSVYETQKACIMIYPTSAECLPKKTSLGKLSDTLTNLKPNTSYTVTYKADNTIRCITTPCPENSFESLSVEFKTLPDSLPGNQIEIKKNLYFGMRNSEVAIMQRMLFERGYYFGKFTGYFGPQTRDAVKKYQKDNDIQATGYFGMKTRESFKNSGPEKFEGKVVSYSTGCFSDGICSITIDNKVVIITEGRRNDVSGSLKGVDSIGDIETKIGHNAEVFAAKRKDGMFTLYGNKEYYINIK